MADVGILAKDWENDSLVRNRSRHEGVLTSWPTKKTMGVASMKACSLNERVLELAALWWVRFKDVPAAIPIDLLRGEAGNKS